MHCPSTFTLFVIKSFYFIFTMCEHCLELLSNKWFGNLVEGFLCMVLIRFVFKIYGMILFLKKDKMSFMLTFLNRSFISFFE